ncbi:MAG: glycine zipper domain-containing protein [Desulfohalobiaceae bacterium]
MSHVFDFRLLIFLLLGILAAGSLSCSHQSSKAQQGSVFGGLAGGLLGSQLGPEDRRRENALIGAGLGFMAGYVIGNEMDKFDQRQLQQTLEYQPSGRSSSWVNPDTGHKFQATPGPARAGDNRIYRDIEISANIDGRQETVQAQAYREQGRWVLVQ